MDEVERKKPYSPKNYKLTLPPVTGSANRLKKNQIITHDAS